MAGRTKDDREALSMLAFLELQLASWLCWRKRGREGEGKTENEGRGEGERGRESRLLLKIGGHLASKP